MKPMKISKYTEKDFEYNLKDQNIEDYFEYLRVVSLQIKKTNPRHLSNINIKEQYNKLINKIITQNKIYRVPTEFNYGANYFKKIYIPAEMYPNINFIGYLIGPSGSTLQKIEHELGIKISIRGKGSYKEESDEPLHCLITADDRNKFLEGVSRIEKQIKDAIEVPENENSLKMDQLKEIGYFNKNKKNSELTDWEKYYVWWYYYNKVDKL